MNILDLECCNSLCALVLSYLCVTLFQTKIGVSVWGLARQGKNIERKQQNNFRFALRTINKETGNTKHMHKREKKKKNDQIHKG